MVKNKNDKPNQDKDNKEVSILEYNSKDHDQTYSLILSIFEVELKNVPSESYLKDIENIENNYGNARERFWTAKIGDKVVGTVAIKQDYKDEALMRRLFVSPTFRKLGIAKKLILTVFKFAKEMNYKEIKFIGNNEMHKARRALLNFGFEQEEEINLGEVKIFKLTKKL